MPVFVRITYGVVAVPLLIALFLVFLLAFAVAGEAEGRGFDRLFAAIGRVARPFRRTLVPVVEMPETARLVA